MKSGELNAIRHFLLSPLTTWTATLFFSLTIEGRLVFGLKGRFCQPRAKPWGRVAVTDDRPERAVRHDFASWGRTALTGRRSFPAPHPGLRPGLTESALQAEDLPVFHRQREKSVAVQLSGTRIRGDHHPYARTAISCFRITSDSSRVSCGSLSVLAATWRIGEPRSSADCPSAVNGDDETAIYPKNASGLECRRKSACGPTARFLYLQLR